MDHTSTKKTESEGLVSALMRTCSKKALAMMLVHLRQALHESEEELFTLKARLVEADRTATFYRYHKGGKS